MAGQYAQRPTVKRFQRTVTKAGREIKKTTVVRRGVEKTRKMRPMRPMRGR